MNTLIRDYIKRDVLYFSKEFKYEGRQLKTISSHDFNKIYRLFELIVESDYGGYSLSGLNVRLPYALQKLSDKNDWNDYVTYIPILVRLFEPYVKRVVSIVNKQSYLTLNNHTTSSLPNYLNAIGLKTKIPKEQRTPETEIIHECYLKRNIESHDCEDWSLGKLFETQSIFLMGFYLVTSQASLLLERVDTKSQLFNYEYLDFDKVGITLDVTDYNYESFFNVSDFAVPLKRVLADDRIIELYDDQGKLTDRNVYNEDGTLDSHSSYEYDIVNGRPIKQYRTDINNGDNRFLLKEYSYNQEGYLTDISWYTERKNGNLNKKVRYCRSHINIEYQTNGCIVIRDYRKKYDPRNDEVVDDRISLLEHIYDSTGRLLSVKTNGKTVKRYSYDQNVLVRINSTLGRIIEVDTLGEEIIFLRKNLVTDDSSIEKVCKYKEGLIYEMVIWGEANQKTLFSFER